MKHDLRSVLATSILALSLLSIAYLIFDWHVHYAEFRSDLAVASVMTGLALLALLSVTTPNRGLPPAFRRDMFEDYYSGAKHVAKGPDGTAGLASSKAHRTFTSTVDGHVARFAGILRQLIERGVGVSPRLTLLRVGA